jgi:hypothetical protein
MRQLCDVDMHAGVASMKAATRQATRISGALDRPVAANAARDGPRRYRGMEVGAAPSCGKVVGSRPRPVDSRRKYAPTAVIVPEEECARSGWRRRLEANISGLRKGPATKRVRRRKGTHSLE